MDLSYFKSRPKTGEKILQKLGSNMKANNQSVKTETCIIRNKQTRMVHFQQNTTFSFYQIFTIRLHVNFKSVS